MVHLWFHGPSKSLFPTHRIFQCREIESSLSRHFAREKTEHTMPKHHIHNWRPKKENVASLFLRCVLVMTFSAVGRKPSPTISCLAWGCTGSLSIRYSKVHSRVRWCVALAAVSAPWCLGQLPGAVSSANITVMQTNGSEHTANGPSKILSRF